MTTCTLIAAHQARQLAADTGVYRLGQVSVLMRLHGAIEMEGMCGLDAGFRDHGLDGAKSEEPHLRGLL